MRKGNVLFSILAVGLVTLTIAEFPPVAASEMDVSVNLTYGSYMTYVNHRVEFTATASGGIPPYTYQWYTMFLPPDVLDDHLILPDGRIVKVAVPGATFPEFNFTQSTPGTYNINLKVVDAIGHDIGVACAHFITVQALPYPSFSPPQTQITPTATPSATPTPTTIPSLPNRSLLNQITLFTVVMLVVLATAVCATVLLVSRLRLKKGGLSN